MTLRKKTLIIVSVTIGSLILILYAASRFIVLDGFAELEKQHTRQNVERALSALSDELIALDTMVFDWAAWDDTYVFIEDANEDYIRSNLVDETFISPRLNFMLFVNSSGQIVFGKAFDLYTEEERPVPQSLRDHLSDGTLLSHLDTASSISGVISLPENPALIASRPILTSKEEGPIRGTLIMGRYLDATEVERLAGITHLSLTLRQFDDTQMPPDFQLARASLSENTPIFIQPLNTESIAGYALVEDIYGAPGLVLKVDMPRDTYKQGQASVLYLVLSLVATSLVLGLVTQLLLEKVVLSRLARLSASVSGVGESGDLSARVLAAGRDELSSLAATINEMLAALEQSHRELQESEKRYRLLFNSGNDMIFVSRMIREDAPGKLVEANDVTCRRLGYTREELLQLSLPDIVALEKGHDFPTIAEKLLTDGLVLFEAAGTAKHGTKIPLEISAHLFDLGGQPAVLSIARDVTERKQAEEALRHLIKFGNLITTIATYFINLPPDEIDGGISHALQAIGELTGVDRGYVYLLPQDRTRIDRACEWCAPGIEPHINDWNSLPVQQHSWWMTKLKWFESIHIPRVADLPPEAMGDQETWLLPATQSVIVIPMVYGGALTGCLSFSSERGEKTWREAEVNLLKTAAGIIASALAQKETEEALQESAQRFHDVTHTTGDWVWEVDAEGRYTYVSPVVEQALGYTPDEVIGRYYHDFLHPDNREEVETRIQEIIHKKEPFVRIVSLNTHKTGNTVILETTGLPLTDMDGNLLGYRGACRNVTPERRLEENLTAVHTLGRELVLSRDRQQVGQVTIEAAQLLLQCHLCELWLVDEAGRALTHLAGRTADQTTDLPTLPLDSERGITVAVARSGEPLYLPNVRKDPRYIDTGIGTRSELCVPLKAREQMVGVLNVESEKLDAFNEDDQQILSTLADQAALAIENARLYERIRTARDRLQVLSSQLVKVQEIERRHIARELHDEIGQLLTGLKFALEMSSRLPIDAARASLEEAQSLVSEILARVRELSLDLRPTMLDDLGLLPALLWHFERYMAQTDIQIALKHTGVEGHRFAPEVETAAYRIVQEALTNVARHSDASDVTVRLWTDHDTLGLQIEDQGTGFDAEAALGAGTSSGLSGMHERVTLLGGRLTIESIPGTGTRLMAEFPLTVSPTQTLSEPADIESL